VLRVVEEAARTDTGRQRHSNEDAYFARSPLYAVADGMGGAQAGEVAAQIAMDAFDDGVGEGAKPEEELARLADTANRRIYELAGADSSRSGMGTTLTGAFLSDDEVSIVHVGDSRAYLFRDGELRQLTRDHSLVEELRRRGELTSEEAEEHPQRSIITRALGPEPEVDLDVHTHNVQSGDVFLLCSDGLTSMVREERVRAILAESRSLQGAADTLVEEANRRGGRDNITAVLFRVGSEGVDGGSSADLDHATLTDLDSTKVRGAAGAGAATGEVAERKRARARERTSRQRWRKLRIALIVVFAVGLITAGVIGASAGLRHVYFIGQDNRGLVTLYRGLPYDLPGGIKLYTSRYISSVQARTLRPFERRRLFDHKLRSHKDAADLIRNLERQR
jgi:protein phosphatase